MAYLRPRRGLRRLTPEGWVALAVALGALVLAAWAVSRLWGR